nr:RNA polymerase sigma factor sigE, chloroplastic/mitochondrial [Tanacetum cinerariifolium]
MPSWEVNETFQLNAKRSSGQQFRFHGFSHEREKKRVASKAHCIVFLPLQPHLVKEAVSTSNQKEMTSFMVEPKRKHIKVNEDEKINRLVKDYSASIKLGSLDSKKMKIPPVLPSSEHTRLFNLVQTIKNVLEREPTDGELADTTNMNVSQLRKQIELGQAARKNLIKV